MLSEWPTLAMFCQRKLFFMFIFWAAILVHESCLTRYTLLYGQLAGMHGWSYALASELAQAC